MATPMPARTRMPTMIQARARPRRRAAGVGRRRLHLLFPVAPLGSAVPGPKVLRLRTREHPGPPGSPGNEYYFMTLYVMWSRGARSGEVNFFTPTAHPVDQTELQRRFGAAIRRL